MLIIKKSFMWSLVLLVSFSFVLPQNRAFASEENLTLLKTEHAFDDEGNKLFLTKSKRNGVETAIVTDETGNEVAKFSLDINKNEAYLNDEKLTSEEFNEIKSFSLATVDGSIQTDEDNLIETAATSSVKYRYAGTHNGSLWVVKAGAAAAAAAIAIFVPGVGWSAALAAGSAIVGSTGTVYYSMKLYYGSSPGYIHVKRSTTFYKDSGRTQKLFGPIVGYQKKSDMY